MVTEKLRPEELGDQESGWWSHFAVASGILSEFLLWAR